jgi:hypothetical protein
LANTPPRQAAYGLHCGSHRRAHCQSVVYEQDQTSGELDGRAPVTIGLLAPLELILLRTPRRAPVGETLPVAGIRLPIPD